MPRVTFGLMRFVRALGIAAFCSVSTFGLQSPEALRYFEQARQSFQQQRWDEAKQAAEKALAADRKMGDAEVLLGLIYTAQSQFNEAEQHFLRAVALEPQNYQAHLYLGSTYLQQKRLPDAAKAFNQVLTLQPGNVAAHYNLGTMALAQDSPSEALKHFEAAARASRSEVPARIGILECQLILHNTQGAQATAHQLETMLEGRDPRLLQVAILLAQHGASRAAIPLIERVRRAYPDSFDVNYNLALAYFEASQYVRAAEVLRPVANSTGKAEAFDLLGTIEEKQGRSKEAEQSFQEAARREPANEDYRFDYGNSLVQHGDLNDALKVLRAAVSDLPKSAKLHTGLGSAWYLAGEYGNAARELLESVRLDPNSATAYFLLGEAYESAGQLQPSIEEAFQKYLKTKPRDPWAFYHYATIQYARGKAEGRSDHADAVTNLNQALRLNPNLAEAQAQLGLIALDQGHTEQGIRALEKAVTLNPSLGQAHYRLGLAFQKLGNSARAKEELDRFRALKNEESNGRRVRESLAQIGR
jgi:tetratricopeptide (TPR) repeat protein